MRETLDSTMDVSAVAPARFTVDGGEPLEQHLAKICAEVCAGVQEIVPPDLLDGLLLGGGYGRGEGGVLKTRDGERPYNDMEFYVFVNGSTIIAEKRFRAALHKLGHDLEPYAGLEVEFKIVNRKTLAKSGTTMFFYDLVCGHYRIFGESSLLDGAGHQRRGENIPLHEATRLLMNRCSGLLFSSERLERPLFTAEDSDFVGRNCSKAELALGDAVLVAYGQYHHSVLERSRLLGALGADAEVPQFDEVVQLHRKGTEFKLHPLCSRESREVLQARLDSLRCIARDIFLWLEGRRLGCKFGSVKAYAMSDIDKCPETPAWRNSLVNMRAFGLSAIAAQPFRYPRRRLFETLPLLLWQPNLVHDLKVSAHLARRLQKPFADFASAVAAYTELWHRFQ
jgi:hypothetical protein